jgi:Iodothyronine deiodinase/EF hand
MGVIVMVLRQSSSFDHGRTRPGGLTARAVWTIALLVLFVTPPLLAGDPPARTRSRSRSPSPSPASAGLSGAAFLEEVWPDHPEWLAMLADILVKGERMSGRDGWFRKGVVQTRFDWKSTRAALDKDGDESISRIEFSGPDADFARLDRNRDGALTAPDFDFASPTAGAVPGALLFSRADRDGNGKVTRAEFDALFTATDSDGLGFLSLADLQQTIVEAPPTLRGSPGGPDGPTRWTFLRGFFRAECGPLPAGPNLNETAPDFTLRLVHSQDNVTLSNLVGPKPVVLVLGNFTCRPFRGEAGDLEKLHERYKDRASFLMVYVREAHPTDGWRMEVNDLLGVTFRQPRTYDERDAIAQICSKTLALGFPMVVDRIDDPVNNRYSGLPSRFYLIDRLGKVAYKGGRGPFGFKPAELEHSLVLLLRQEETAAHADLKDKPITGVISRRSHDGSN